MKSSLAALKRHVLPAVVAFCAAYILSEQTELGPRLENVVLDWQTRRRAVWRPVPPSEELLLAGIDRISLQMFEPSFGRWPWARVVHGDLLQLLAQPEPNGPSVVGFDIVFPERSSDDDKFIEGLKLSRLDVVLGAEALENVGGPQATQPRYGIVPGSSVANAARLSVLQNVAGDRSRVLTYEAMLLPVGELAQIATVGFVDTPPGPDGVRREVPLMVRVGDTIYPTLSLQVLLKHWHASPEQVRVKLGDAIEVDTPAKTWRIPIDARGTYYVNYRHTASGVANIGYSALHDSLRERYVEDKPTWVPKLTDRIVLIGQVADTLTDFGPTPLSSHTPLVLVHTNIIQNVLQGDFVRRFPPLIVWVGGFLLGIVSLAVFAERKLWQQIAFSLCIPLLYFGLATLAWVFRSAMLPVTGPVLGFASVQIFIIARRVFIEQRAKEQIKGAFSAYLSPTLVERLAASGAMPQLGGHEENITAYFSDIQGYSTFSEKLPPAQLVELLNTYLTVCTDIVQEEGGTLDKYIGDAVVAMFGAPVPLPDHAYRACVAALRVQHALGELRVRWNREAERWPEGVLKMQSRIGLNTGPAIIGNMGSRSRFSYTMTGDNVNLAARMESGAKSWGAYTMCTEATRLACVEHGGDRVIFRPLGRIVVMGRNRADPIYEIVTLKEILTAETRECLERFEAALAKYHARDWAGAIAGFEASARLEPNQPGRDPGVKSNPSLIYIGISRSCLSTPPAADWDGSYVMTEK